MAQREWKEKNIDEAFFPVEALPVHWYDEYSGTRKKIPGKVVILDTQQSNPLAVVSDKYQIVTNEDAYHLAEYVIRRIFPSVSLSDFLCYNVLMPKTRSYCRIDLIIPTAKYSPFANKTDNWTPFVRISNSYNRMLSLKYEVGFCRWICLNGVIFGQQGITLSINHDDKLTLSDIRRKIDQVKGVAQIDSLWNDFTEKMVMLKNIEVCDWMVFPMFCKVFDITVAEDEMSDNQKENWRVKIDHISSMAREYFDELGSNAYALMNVFTDYASFPVAAPNNATLIHAYQRRVGDWVDNIKQERKKADFNMSDYIGQAAIDTAASIEQLVNAQK